MATDWGSYQGHPRKPCPEDPVALRGQPIGMYHCPGCLMMVLAGVDHPNPGATDEQKAHPLYTLDDFEDDYQQPWPPGYEDGWEGP